ncbi:MAG: gfo/Idh/MocA family oxidoreductase [Planctomycetota bacterium]|nr:MAG: gfo/Idh/MocA family oxidoreductase [Planctomycetota bacterium]
MSPVKVVQKGDDVHAAERPTEEAVGRNSPTAPPFVPPMPSSDGPIAPDRPVRFGILGTARIAVQVAAAIRGARGAELRAVASRDAERARRWAEEHGCAVAYGDYRQLLQDETIDVVYIPLPPALHPEWTIRAAEAGKHVLCEKPLAATLADARSMVAACRGQGVQLMDGVMWIHHPRTAAMKQCLLNGDFGPLRRVTSAFSFCWPRIPENEFRLQRAMGGGSLLDLGWYCVGAAIWAFEALPERVFGAADWYGDVDLSFSGWLDFGDHRTAAIESAFDRVRRRWIEVAGTQLSLVCDDYTRPWDDQRPRFWLHDSDGRSEERVVTGPRQEVCMVEDFVRLVQSGRLEPRWPQWSLQVQAVCELLDRSAREGKLLPFAASPA